MILFRKRYGYTVKRAVLYSVLTLAFGYIAVVISAKTGNYFVWLANGKNDVRLEPLNSYGLQLFWPPFMLLYCLLFRDKFKTLTDYATPSIMFAQTLGKVACSFAGCCYGPKDPKGMYLVQEGFRAFPVQVCDTVCIGLIFILSVVLLFTFSKKHPGYIFPISGMLYALQKGYWEEYRVYDYEAEGNFFNTGRTFWQFFLVFLFVGCLIWLIGAIIYEKKGKPDFDESESIKLPDLSKLTKKLANRIRSLISEKMKKTETDSKSE